MPVAEEAAVTAWAMGHQVDRIYDVRLLVCTAALPPGRSCEGPMSSSSSPAWKGPSPASLGAVDKPIIAVPTSIGYGAHLDGLALLTMLNSCASGVAAVNIDNGFGAGYMAAIINRLACGSGSEQEHGG